jgi:hypothetical protein
MPFLRTHHSKAPLIALILVVLAIVASAYAFSRREPSSRDVDEARQTARAGLADALQRLEKNPQWSTDFSSTAEELNPETYTVRAGEATARVSVDRFAPPSPADAEHIVAAPRVRQRIISTASIDRVTVTVRAEVEITPTGAVQVIAQSEEETP